MVRRDVFQAIADPTRREILHHLAYKSQNVNAIAEKFDISRQAISLQIKILEECGLIVVKKKGRERHCEAKLQSLQDVAAWVGKFQTFWENKLDALEQHVEKMQASTKNSTQ